MLHFILGFLSGALLCNAIPHLAAGLRGEAFPTLFGNPPAYGNSPPVVNALWGTFNLFLGLWLFHQNAWFGTALGFTAMAVGLARHFGKLRGKPNP
jgi:hypothetical protein